MSTYPPWLQDSNSSTIRAVPVRLSRHFVQITVKELDDKGGEDHCGYVTLSTMFPRSRPYHNTRSFYNSVSDSHLGSLQCLRHVLRIALIPPNACMYIR